MGRIPQVAVNTSKIEFTPTNVNQIVAVGNAKAGAIEEGAQLAGAVGSGVSAFEEAKAVHQDRLNKQLDRDAAWNASLEFTGESAKAIQGLNNADDINKISENFNEFQKNLTEKLSTGMTDEARNLFQRHIFNAATGNIRDVSILQGNRQQEQGIANLNANIDKIAAQTAAIKDPTAKAIAAEQADELISKNDWVPPEARLQLLEDFKERVTELEHKIEYDNISDSVEEALRNPNEAWRHVKIAEERLEAAVSLTGDESVTLQRAINTARDNARTVSNRLTADVQEAEALDFVERINDGDPKTVLTVQNVLDSTLDFKTKEHFLTEIEAKHRGLLVDEGNPSIQMGLLRRVNDTEADNHIDSVLELLPFLGEGLSGGFFQVLQRRIETMQKPGNRLKEKAFSVYMDSARKTLITTGNVPINDPAGQADYVEFYTLARGLFDDGIKEGLTPEELLDPKNKRFIGRSIDKFITPLKEKVETAIDIMIRGTTGSDFGGSSGSSSGSPDAVETPKATTSQLPAWQGFPTSHPMVDNGDGSVSNVVLGSWWFGGEEAGATGGREIVIPTMVDGKPLTDEEAIAIAREHGLDKYPQFGGTREEAEKAASKWAEENHGNINEAGQLIENPEDPERRPGETSWQWCARTGLCQ